MYAPCTQATYQRMKIVVDDDVCCSGTSWIWPIGTVPRIHHPTQHEAPEELSHSAQQTTPRGRGVSSCSSRPVIRIRGGELMAQHPRDAMATAESTNREVTH